MEPFPGTKCAGVDLNRNFDAHWNEVEFVDWADVVLVHLYCYFCLDNNSKLTTGVSFYPSIRTCTTVAVKIDFP